MTEISNIKQLELQSLTSLQHELHTPKNNDSKEDIQTEYTNAFPKKVAWKSQVERELDVSTKHEKVVYHVDMASFDVVEKAVIIQQLPKLVVKKQYEGKIQMCWPDNLLHIIYTMIDLCFDTDPVQTLTPHSNTVFRNYFSEKRKHYLKTIGNRPHLTEWTEALSADTVNAKQPFYFNEHKCKSIPLYMCKDSKITFECVFRLHLKDILKVRELRNNEWIRIPFHTRYFHGIPTGAILDNPKMKAKYTHLTEDEKNSRIEEPNGGVFYYDDFIYIPPKNPISLDSRDVIDLQTTDPCKAIFILVENIESSKNRDYCDYTDDGFSVIYSAELTYQDKYRKVIKVNNRYIEDILSEDFPKCPYEKGLGAIPLTSRFKTISPDVGITFSTSMKASLIVNYANTDPKFNKSTIIENVEEHEVQVQDEPEEAEIKIDDKKKKFLPHYLLLVTKKIEFDGRRCKRSSNDENK
jgi:hypothetical protein